MKDETKTPKIKESKFYGELCKADIVVPKAFKPKDEYTNGYVDGLLEELGFRLKEMRKTSRDKHHYIISDFLIGCRWAQTKNGLISWVGRSEFYSGGAYGADTMRKVKDALESKGLIWMVQKSSRFDKLARVYSYDSELAPDWLEFTHHGLGECVEVRSAKDTWDTGKTETGGKRIPRKKFLGQIEPLEAQMKTINNCLLKNPLQFWDGREFAWSRRIFNNGRLDHGGRIYGPWQTAPEEERLASTINGFDVCEIDLKASYPSIINAALDYGYDLGPDPYSTIRFIQSNKELRKLAKDLVSAHICSKSGLSRFPKGIRKKHSLKRTDKLSDYMNDIFDALPFLRGVHSRGINWMYIESELIVATLESLALKGIPAYPVHDSIICKKKDQDIAVTTLREKMIESFGEYIHLDVSYYNEDNNIIQEVLENPTPPKTSTSPRFKFSKYDWGVEDEDLLEDIDLIE
ncbi:hypothetical protein [Pseudodonghicola xiamenensis]|uniref:DNA polymerase family A n=1 Tax=Pseudodonghicola xiamenensis TaxID=337702 RepID=A0A8J3HD28_9RHOB|nr:hypothetical protein [Pseudodonghicola xiamenensis]GHH05890.1 hypothetical protein GCM10010961_44840 [Pseudodonghicola xiamenensis]